MIVHIKYYLSKLLLKVLNIIFLDYLLQKKILTGLLSNAAMHYPYEAKQILVINYNIITTTEFFFF